MRKRVLRVVFLCYLAASALADDDKGNEQNEGRTRSFGGGLSPGFGGGINSGFGGGINPGFGGGINPGFGGGINQGFGGGINPGFGGGINPGFGGGINPGFGGGINPGFGGGINPGFGGGINPGFGGGINPGFGGGFGGVSQTCRRWCRTPEGQAYCCESNNEPETLPFVKPGQCPPVRPQCPPVRSFAPPQTCSNDSKCGGVDKCCFDRCLEEHVCKPPVGSGGFGGFGFGR
ncbi:pupal cuticle protein Edg-91-like [Palaemon carinicauda]|uniref:pupal cuticle protein Edg-91-like n=1 Tax=Palaemon carinicauda TaxID=392227 RepID=UPI0035B63E0C